jgi:hypothetical protein
VFHAGRFGRLDEMVIALELDGLDVVLATAQGRVGRSDERFDACTGRVQRGGVLQVAGDRMGAGLDEGWGWGGHALLGQLLRGGVVPHQDTHIPVLLQQLPRDHATEQAGGAHYQNHRPPPLLVVNCKPSRCCVARFVVRSGVVPLLDCIFFG